jgi:hypothetical protein
MKRTLTSLATFALAASMFATPALARNGADDPAGDDSGGGGGGNGTQVVRTGTCTGPSTAKIKAKPRNGGFEVEFEVDRNRTGVHYNVVLRHNGAAFSHTTRTTAGRSGSFSISRHASNRTGTDRFSATATRAGEICRASLSI